MKTLKTITTTMAIVLFGLFAIGQNQSETTVSVIGIPNNGKISVEKLLTIGKIEISDKTFTVIGFTICSNFGYHEDPMVGLASWTSNSNVFNDNMKNCIKKLKSGNKLFIEEIQAKKEDGTVLKLPGMSLTIE